MNYGAFMAQAAFFWTRELIDKDPVHALAANLAALRQWPFSSHERLQIAMSFANVMSRWPSCDDPAANPETQCVRVTAVAADRISEIAKSAMPLAPSVLLSRINYLIYSGRHKTEDGRAEIERNLALAKRHASLQATTWLTEAAWAGMNGDGPRLLEAVRRGAPQARDPEAYYLPQFQTLAASLIFEEAGP